MAGNSLPLTHRRKKYDDDKLRKQASANVVWESSRRLIRAHPMLSILGFAAILLLLLRCYLWTIEVWGTVAPFAVMAYTKPFGGLTVEEILPPKQWRPRFRVVVSLTTRPGRLNHLQETVDSLVSQSLLPDKIYLNIPEGKMARSEETFSHAEIPASLDKHPHVEVNRCRDVGPMTKLHATLLKEDDPNTVVITVDDDFVYPTDMVAALAWQASHTPHAAVGVCGWGAMGWSKPLGVVPVYVPYWQRPTGAFVDILQACCGIAYRRGFFDAKKLEAIPPKCFTVDDVWISGYLATIAKVPRAIVSKRLDPSSPSWKHQEEKKELKLSTFNDKNYIHTQCIDEIEKRHGKWTRVWEIPESQLV